MRRGFGKINSILLVGLMVFSIFSSTIVANKAAASDNAVNGGYVTIAPNGFFMSMVNTTVGDLLFWQWTTIPADFPIRLKVIKPDYSYISTMGNGAGIKADMTGYYALVFYNDDAVNSVVVVYATILVIQSNVKIVNPAANTLQNSRTTSIDVRCDDANEVFIQLNQGIFRPASMSNGLWHLDASLVEGTNTIVAEAHYYSNETSPYKLTLTTSTTIVVDDYPPTATIISPVDGSTIDGPYANLTWTCMDNSGIADQEVKLDDGLWQSPTSSEFSAENLSAGNHTFYLKVTDNANNQVTKTVNFTTEIDKSDITNVPPFVILGAIIGLIIVVIITASLLIIAKKKIRRLESQSESRYAQDVATSTQEAVVRPAETISIEGQTRLPPPPSN